MQKQALKLYREALRVIQRKSFRGDDENLKLRQMIRNEFEKHRNVDKRDIMRVEHLLRQGEKQVKRLESVDTVNNM